MNISDSEVSDQDSDSDIEHSGMLECEQEQGKPIHPMQD